MAGKDTIGSQTAKAGAPPFLNWGQTDAAIDHLAEATSIAKRLDATYWIAASSIEGAAALRARDRADDASRADRLITEAITLAELHGYGRVVTRARVLR